MVLNPGKCHYVLVKMSMIMKHITLMTLIYIKKEVEIVGIKKKLKFNF